MMPKRIVVMASGQGTNLQALIDATREGGLLHGKAAIVGVFSHTPTALALERARRHDIPAVYCAPPRKHEDKAAWDATLAARVAAFEPDLVVLAGWMRILRPAFIDRFPDPRRPGQARILNLHPALPGEIPGTDAIATAYAEALRGARRETGVMVHVVVPEVDAGPVVAVERVPIPPGVALEELEASVHAVEHRLLVRAVADFLADPEVSP
jgi:formyltetrahydrofolate-dependent phosphoribosylglycinamide formyltransferase